MQVFFLYDYFEENDKEIFVLYCFLSLNILEHLLQCFTDFHSLRENKNPCFLAVLNILKLCYWSHRIEFEVKVGFRDIKQ